MRRVALPAAFLLLAASLGAQPTNPLQQTGETTIIAFKLQASGKWVSVSRSNMEKDPSIVYRFGRPSKIELEYPNDRANSWKDFEYAFYFRGGGAQNAGLDLNYLSFVHGDWKYVIYQEYDAEADSLSVGIRLYSQTDDRKIELEGAPSSLVGSLVDLRDNDQIKRGDIPSD